MPEPAAALPNLQKALDYPRLEAENAELHSKLEAAEGRIEQTRKFVKLRVHHSSMYYRALLDILSEPANAEGIASEGGSAKAANPHEVLTDAPSAEAGGPMAQTAAYKAHEAGAEEAVERFHSRPPVRTANTSWEPHG
jgi:hypothetical protein